MPRHLWIVVSRVLPATEQVLAVNVSSYNSRLQEDPTTLLRDGDHPFIHHLSYVNYNGARLVNLGVLEQLLDSGDVWLGQSVDAQLLWRVQGGFATSPRARREHAKLLRKQGILPS